MDHQELFTYSPEIFTLVSELDSFLQAIIIPIGKWFLR